MFRDFFLPRLVWIIYRSLMWTWKIEFFESDELKELAKNNQTFVLAHWHSDELALLPCVPRYKLATMISTSNDGQLAAYVFNKLGGKNSDGSSTRGGVSALKGLIRLCRAGSPTSIAVDGPKGPIYKVKPGVFEISKLCKAKVFPLTASASSFFVSEKSWNKAMLPKPFSTVHIHIGNALPGSGQNLDAKDPKLAESLGKCIIDTKHHAVKQMDALIAEC